MNIFNSLGSNYDTRFVLRSIISFPRAKDRYLLVSKLQRQYVGDIHLFHKGRYALEAGLRMLDLPNGSAVVINGFTCFVVYKAINNVGLEVEYLDISQGDLNFSLEGLKNYYSKNPKIKVVIIQNTLGYPADVKSISKFCKENNLILIEDLAHSEGGKYGDIVCLSFSQDKITDGVSGGALVIRNKKLIKNVNLNIKDVSLTDSLKDRFYPLFTYLIRSLYPFGFGKTLHFFLKSISLLSKPVDKINDVSLYGLPNWNAKMTMFSLDNKARNIAHRKKIAQIYKNNLNKDLLSPLLVNKIEVSSNIRFPIFVNKKDQLIKYLKAKGVYLSDIWYDAVIAPKKYMKKTSYSDGVCEEAERISKSILNLPTHTNINKKQALQITKYINQWANIH